MPSTSR